MVHIWAQLKNRIIFNGWKFRNEGNCSELLGLLSTVMILSFRTDMPGQTVQTQISSCSLIRVYTICHSICIVWTHYSMVEPHSSNFRVITTNFLGVQIFRKFTVILKLSRVTEFLICTSQPFEPPHDKTNKMACASSEDSAWASAQSDQSLLSTWRKLGSLATHWVHGEDFDQTGWVHRLIWDFAGCINILLVLSWGSSFSYMPYLTLWDKISQNLAHLEANSHKVIKSHRIFRPSYNTFYEEININHTLLFSSQASYI